jgi:hypothetical protein
MQASQLCTSAQDRWKWHTADVSAARYCTTGIYLASYWRLASKAAK